MGDEIDDQDHHAGSWRLAQRVQLGEASRHATKHAAIPSSRRPGRFDDRPPAELRAAPHPELKNVGPHRIVDHFEQAIRALPEQPIIIGHSVGGVYTQMLLDRGLGVAGVAIDPAPTPGVPLGLQAIISAAPVFFSWGSWGRVMTMSRKFFGNRFAQTVPKAEQDAHL